MLRRRTAKPKPASPEPKDPSTVPDAVLKPAEPETAAEAPVVDPDSPAAPEAGKAPSPDKDSFLPEDGQPVLTSEAALSTGPATGPADTSKPDPIEQVVSETSPFNDSAEIPAPEARDTKPVDLPGPLPDVPPMKGADATSPPAEKEIMGIPVRTESSPLKPVPTPPVPKPITPPTRATLPPRAPLATKRKGNLVGGIDLGGTKIAAAVLGLDHEVISYRRRPTPDKGGPEDVVKAMAVTIQEAAQDAGCEAHTLRAVGVGCPGAVDTATGAVSGAGNLPGWSGRFQLGMALREAIGTPVTVGNDVAVATNAEYALGVGKEYDSLLGVFWGTGVGGGLILNGKPWHGRGKAGEIGHMVVKIGGAKCGCGNRGCMEAYAGRKSMEAKAIKEHKKGAYTDLFRLAEKHGKPHLTSAIWAKALAHEDPLATELLDRAVTALSAGIASAINLFDPDAVVIGGGLGIRFGDTLVPKIVDGMGEHLFDSDNPPPVKVAALGDEGGVIGASLLLEQTI